MDSSDIANRKSLTDSYTVPHDNSEPNLTVPAGAIPNSGSKTPPPPYPDGDELSNNVNNLYPAVPSTTTTYSVPKDVTEGLSNPVFQNTQNPDDDSDTSKRVSRPVETLSSCVSVPANASFTSLNSYEQTYASQTILYSKDKPDDNIDSEKGKPCAGDVKDNNNAPSKKKGEEKEYKGMKKYLGLLLTFSASFFFSVVVLFVKVLKDYGFDAYGASFWRYTGTVIPVIPLLFFYECGPGVKKQESIFGTVWPVWKNENWKTWIGLLSRGIIGSSSVILRYYALQYLTIGDTSVITYSTPVLVTVLAHFFLGERCGVFPIIVAFVTLCGVVIVTKPPLLTGAAGFDTNTLV